MEELTAAVLEWWEEHRRDSVPMGDEEWDNVYDIGDTPEFVRIAQKLSGN